MARITNLPVADVLPVGLSPHATEQLLQPGERAIWCAGPLPQIRSFLLDEAARGNWRAHMVQNCELLPGALPTDGSAGVVLVEVASDEQLQELLAFCEAIAGRAEFSELLVITVCRVDWVARIDALLGEGIKRDYLLPELPPEALRQRLNLYLTAHHQGRLNQQAKLHLRLAEGVMTSMIGSRQRSETELRRFKHALDSALDTVLMFDADTLTVVYANRGASTTFGYSHRQWLAKSLDQVTSRLQPQRLRATLQPLLDGVQPSTTLETTLRAVDGREIPVSMFLQLVTDEEGAGLFLSFVTDISDQVAQRALLEHQSLHDALTGLPNRSLFMDRLRQALSAAGRNQQVVGVLMIDLDGFKEVNDTLGHHVGDQLLKWVGNNLHTALRGSDTVARLGGDEFAVLVTGAESLAQVKAVADKLQHTLSRGYEVDGYAISVRCSIGIALFPAHGDDEISLLRRADVAMYEAKRNSRENTVVYDFEQDRDKLLLLRLESELRNAIGNEELVLHYQPKVDLTSGKLLGFEALVRWQHPDKGMVPPDAFITVAERSGLINALTRHVIDAALRQLGQWNQQGHRLLVAVNLSARDLHDSQLPNYVRERLAHWGVSASQLQLELTESDLMADTELVTRVLNDLCRSGVTFAVDDFGTGYSSLSYLKRLPVAELKIDKSFVMQMADNGDDLVIVHSTINMAHHLGLRVVAEGVEDLAAWELLQVLECDVAQGFFIQRPIPASDLGAWLAEGAFDPAQAAATA